MFTAALWLSLRFDPLDQRIETIAPLLVREGFERRVCDRFIGEPILALHRGRDPHAGGD